MIAPVLTDGDAAVPSLKFAEDAEEPDPEPLLPPLLVLPGVVADLLLVVGPPVEPPVEPPVV